MKTDSSESQKSDRISVLYFSTIDGPTSRKKIKRWNVVPISRVHLYDCNEFKKFTRIIVDDAPWPAKKTNAEEFWPHYLIDIGDPEAMRKQSSRIMPNVLKTLCFTCSDIQNERPVITFVEKNPFPASIAEILVSLAQKERKKLLKKKRNSAPTEDTVNKRKKNANPTQLDESLDSNDDILTSTAVDHSDCRLNLPESPIVQPSQSTLRAASLSQVIRKPQNYPKKDEPWPLVWYFAVNHLNDCFTNRNYGIPNRNNYFNYIDLIQGFIITAVRTVGDLDFCDDYQIIDSVGSIYTNDSLCDKIVELSEKVETESTKHRKRICKACDGKCSYSKILADISVRRHIIDDVLKCTFICIKCGSPLKGKQLLTTHSEKCKYEKRVGMENVHTKDFYSLYTQLSHNKMQRLETPDPKPILQSNEEKFVEFLELGYEKLKQDDLITNFSTFDDFYSFLKNDFDYTFWLYFTGQIAPTAYAAELYDFKDSGDYYGIYLCNNLTGNNKEPTKSVCFRIFEVKDNAYISIHKLTALQADIMSDKVRTCNYINCRCKHSFTVGFEKDLMGHILVNNFLVVCAGCRRGYAYWPQFMKHFTDDCYIERPVRTDLVVVKS